MWAMIIPIVCAFASYIQTDHYINASGYYMLADICKEYDRDDLAKEEIAKGKAEEMKAERLESFCDGLKKLYPFVP